MIFEINALLRLCLKPNPKSGQMPKTQTKFIFQIIFKTNEINQGFNLGSLALKFES